MWHMMRMYRCHQQIGSENVGSVVFQDIQEERVKNEVKIQLFMLIYLSIAIPVYCHLAEYHAILGLELQRVNFYHYKHPAASLSWRM